MPDLLAIEHNHKLMNKCLFYPTDVANNHTAQNFIVSANLPKLHLAISPLKFHACYLAGVPKIPHQLMTICQNLHNYN